MKDNFLAAILAKPADDAPRLVYADWLDEHGDAERAEFIRIQCELEKVPPGHLPPPVLDRRGRTRDTVHNPKRTRLAERAALLLQRHGEEWAGPLHGLVAGYEFRRGFVEAVAIKAGKFVERADKLFGLAPIRHARLKHADSHLGALLKTTALGRLTGLDLSWNYFFDEDAQGWTALLTSPRLEQLRALRVEKSRGSGTLPDESFQALLATTHFQHLTELDLMDQALGDEEVEALAAWPCLATVARLDLTGSTFGEAGARALARSPYLTHLVELNLSYTDIPPAGWKALLDSPNLANLKWLGLETVGLDYELEEAIRERYGEENVDEEAGF